MANEMSIFLRANYVQVFMVQQEIVEDKKLHKCCHIGTTLVKDKCPNKQASHTDYQFRFS